MRYGQLEEKSTNSSQRCDQVKTVFKQDIVHELPFGDFLLQRTRQNFYFGFKHLVQMTFSSWLMMKIAMPNMAMGQSGDMNMSQPDDPTNSPAMIAKMTGAMWLGMTAAGWGCNLIKRGTLSVGQYLGFFRQAEESTETQQVNEDSMGPNYQSSAS